MDLNFQRQLEELFQDKGIGTLVTLKDDGRPQLSNVMYYFDRQLQQFLISVTDTRVKTDNIRRDNRVSVHVNGEGGWSYAVAEGRGHLSTTAQDPHDGTVGALVQLYQHLQGEHPDWDEFRMAMIRERRVVLTVQIERVYGMTPQ